MGGGGDNCLLELLGKTPSTKYKLTSFVMDGIKVSTQSLRRNVGTWSKGHDLVGEFFIIFNMSFEETSQKYRLGVNLWVVQQLW